MLGVARGVAYESVRNGEIPATRVGRRWLIPRKRFHAWLDGERPDPPPRSGGGLMGFIDKTPEGRYRAYFRDPAGKQRSKTFRIKKDATAFLAEIETSKTARGLRLAARRAGAVRRPRAQWMATWNTEATTAARDRSIMRTHVLPRWGDMCRSARSTTSGCRSG